MTLTEKLDELADESQWDFSDLRALFINCTLKKSPEPSHTQGLADLAISIMEKNRVKADVVRAVVMAAGVLVLARARHGHLHTHAPLTHDHLHTHDAHHRHTHEGTVEQEPHSHLHTHGALTHEHPHVSDAHHKHRH